jgi:Taurine catabolism dioxygenase TauD, TfdA family
MNLADKFRNIDHDRPGWNVNQGDPLGSDLPALADHVHSNLAAHGWVHVAHSLSEADFEAVAARIGTNELRTNIVVDPERERLQKASRGTMLARPGVYQAAALDMHTDRPTAHVLAWYCVEQDDQAGATLLIDTSDLTDHFSDADLDGLGRVHVTCAIRDPITSKEIVKTAPLLTRRGDTRLLYFVPWLVDQLTGEAELELLQRFIRYVRMKEENDLIPIRLERGQSLFIDNRRMLHGRGELPAGSRRHLIRLYLRTVEGGPAPWVELPGEG